MLHDLEANDKALHAAYGQLAAAIRAKKSVSPAAEWFVDNFHIVEDQIRQVRQDLPRNFYRELPKPMGT
jgi:cyclic beta-1,2-glucan synthetase